MLCDCGVGVEDVWFAGYAEKLSVGRNAKKEKRLPAAKSGRTSQLDRDRIEGTIPSGRDQRHMGGLYRVGGSGASRSKGSRRSPFGLIRSFY